MTSTKKCHYLWKQKYIYLQGILSKKCLSDQTTSYLPLLLNGQLVFSPLLLFTRLQCARRNPTSQTLLNYTTYWLSNMNTHIAFITLNNHLFHRIPLLNIPNPSSLYSSMLLFAVNTPELESRNSHKCVSRDNSTDQSASRSKKHEWHSTGLCVKLSRATQTQIVHYSLFQIYPLTPFLDFPRHILIIPDYNVDLIHLCWMYCLVKNYLDLHMYCLTVYVIMSKLLHTI